MLIARIEGCTRELGKGQGYLGLPIRDVLINCKVGGEGTPAMESVWEPTPEELAMLNKGAKVLLRVVGRNHPPVLLTVEELP